MGKILQDRLALHEILCEILNSRNVYFQPPSSILMSYPAIRYERVKVTSNFADNSDYFNHVRYQLTLISRDPDNDGLIEAIMALPLCGYDRSYAADNLNHDVFTIYV